MSNKKKERWQNPRPKTRKSNPNGVWSFELDVEDIREMGKPPETPNPKPEREMGKERRNPETREENGKKKRTGREKGKENPTE